MLTLNLICYLLILLAINSAKNNRSCGAAGLARLVERSHAEEAAVDLILRSDQY